MKYVVSYGIAGAFARLDNMEPPPTPRCIARIHVYSQMWKHFDVGLYRFLVKLVTLLCIFFIISVCKNYSNLVLEYIFLPL